MHNRRDFLRYGMGLAGVLASGEAPAVIRSVLGAKGIMVSGGAPRPYYAEVEYLESTGTQWIDTGITSGIHGIRVVGNILFTNITYWDGHNAVFGSLGGSSGLSQLLTLDHTNWQARWCRTGSPQYLRIGNVSANIRYHIDISLVSENIYFEVDGALLYSSNRSFSSGTSSEPIYLNALWYSSSPGIYPTSPGELGYNRYYGQWKFYDAGGKIVRDFQPVRFTNENGMSEGAMYDRVSGELFRNQGTGSFIIGPAK